MSVRVRYAPSPTGDPHLGILRTALFDYLFAKQQGGVFILRLEDTDQKREKDGSDRAILESLRWLGIEPDEGLYLDMANQIAQRGAFGPYIQSERLPIYHEHTEKLLANGTAYRCFCTAERLSEMRAEQERNHQPPRYDRHCRHLSRAESDQRALNESFVVRQAMPDNEEIIVEDLVRGEIRFQSSDLDDQVLLKSDGFPTYQLANVVDDHLMQISHVFRGEEWIPSTPKNVLLYRNFGWTLPFFAHMPVILGPDGKHKLSKREGADPVLTYRARGYLPEAVVNFLAFLGWSPGTEEEIFSLAELVERFQLEHVQKAAAVFNPERLDYLNGWYIRQLPVERVAALMRPYLQAGNILAEESYLCKVAAVVQERLKHFDETMLVAEFFFERPTVNQELLALVVPKKSSSEETLPILQAVTSFLETIPEGQWSLEVITEKLRSYIEEHELKNVAVLWPIRAALTGVPGSPGAFEMLATLGKAESIARLQAVVVMVSSTT